MLLQQAVYDLVADRRSR